LRLAKADSAHALLSLQNYPGNHKKEPLFVGEQPVPSGKKWKNMKNPSKKCLQNGNIGVIMIDGLFSKGVKRRES